MCIEREKREDERTFRHSFAVNSVRHGVDTRWVQQDLGRENLSTVAAYLQSDDKGLQDA